MTKPEEMAWLRLQGGVFDYFLPVASGRDHALWLEMKRTTNGVASINQVNAAALACVDDAKGTGAMKRR